MELRVLPVAEVHDPDNPLRARIEEHEYEDLVRSMRDMGLLVPIEVTPVEGGYEVVDGHRRLMAARTLGWSTIPCYVTERRGSELLAVRIHANLVRESVTAAEEAVYLADLGVDGKDSVAELAEKVSRSEAWVRDRLSLLEADEAVFSAVLGRKLNLAQARELNKITEPTLRRFRLATVLQNPVSAAVIKTWREVDNGEMVTAAQAADASVAGRLDKPLILDSMTCQVCGEEHVERTLVPVWIHQDEWNMIKSILNNKHEGSTEVTNAGE